MKTLLITKSQMDALTAMCLHHVMTDESGVVYSAHVSLTSAQIMAKRIEWVNNERVSAHSLKDCIASDEVAA